MKPIVIMGPTAIGKTELAIKLARQINGEIISADSMQIYRGMDIGTAKPTELQRKTVKHHLIDIKNPIEKFSAGEFARLANNLIKEIQSRNKNPIIVGGTGFYLDALINGLDDVEPIDKKIKVFFDDICEELGSNYLYGWLKEIDEQWADRISPFDCQRIKRGLGYYVDKGVPMSSKFGLKQHKKGDFLIFVLYASKEFLKERIKKRTEKMLESGLIDEVIKLINKGYGTAGPMKSIGYKETAMYIQGKIKNKAELAQEIVNSTLAYAKRQITFFKSKFKDAHWIDVEKQEPLAVILNAAGGHSS